MEWRGTAHSARMGWLAAGLGVAAAVLVPLAPLVSLVLIVSGVAVALFTKVRVDIDDSGVHIRSPISVPRITIPFERIKSVQAIDVRPMKHGGWGYRGSLRLFRRAAWIVRAGPGLQLDLRDRRTFVVTVDEADEAAKQISRRHDVEPE